MQQSPSKQASKATSTEASWFGLTITTAGLVSLTVLTLPFLRRYSGAPYVASSPAAQMSIRNFLQRHKATTTDRPRMVDLGSGSGEHVLSAAKIGYDAVGVERNVWLVLYSRLRAWRTGVDAQFVWGDLWKRDCTNVDVVVVFGVPTVMKRVGQKLRSECKDGCIVCSHMFDIPKWTAMRNQGGVRFYRIGDQ